MRKRVQGDGKWYKTMAGSTHLMPRMLPVKLDPG